MARSYFRIWQSMHLPLLRPRLTSITLTSTTTRTFATKQKSVLINEIFQDHGAAAFVGASGPGNMLPKLSGLPEAIVIGRANVGKSTLLNAVLGRRDLVYTSKKAGRTRTLNFYRVGRPPGHCVLVDAPGYGSRGRPEWGEVFDWYVGTRKELRRIFVLINASHGLKPSDIQMLDHLCSKILTPSLSLSSSSSSSSRTPTNLHPPGRDSNAQPFTIQTILTKADTVPRGQLLSVVQTLTKELVEKGPVCLPPIVTSLSPSLKVGVEDVRASLGEACGLLGR